MFLVSKEYSGAWLPIHVRFWYTEPKRLHSKYKKIRAVFSILPL